MRGCRGAQTQVNYNTKWTLPLQNVSDMVPFFIFIDFYNRKFPNSEVCRVLVGVKDKVSPPRLPGNVRFGRRIVANGVLGLGVRQGSSVTISALRV